ncbi:MAG: phage tail protein [Myxococcota bacterium]
MARVAKRQPPAWTAEGLGLDKEVRDVARELGLVRDSIPAGETVGRIVLFTTGQEPGEAWRQCDGAPISRFDYPELFEAIGETHGAGDGSTTVNLPNMAAPASTTYWIRVKESS